MCVALAHVLVFVCACMCKSQRCVNVRCLLLSHSMLFFEAGSLREPIAHQCSQTGWPVNFRDPVSVAPVKRLYCIQIYMRALGIWIHFLCSRGKHFTNGTISPAPATVRTSHRDGRVIVLHVALCCSSEYYLCVLHRTAEPSGKFGVRLSSSTTFNIFPPCQTWKSMWWCL